jgi:hypothetical protein
MEAYLASACLIYISLILRIKHTKLLDCDNIITEPFENQFGYFKLNPSFTNISQSIDIVVRLDNLLTHLIVS